MSVEIPVCVCFLRVFFCNIISLKLQIQKQAEMVSTIQLQPGIHRITLFINFMCYCFQNSNSSILFPSYFPKSIRFSFLNTIPPDIIDKI